MFEKNVPDLYYFLNSVRFSSIGTAPIMPGQNGYETATPLNIFIKISDLDDIKASVERRMESTDMRTNPHWNAVTECLGCLEGNGLYTEENGSMFVETDPGSVAKVRYGNLTVLKTRSLATRFKLTDLSVEMFNQFTPPIIDPVAGFLITIDDFVNHPSGSISTIGSGAEAKRDGRTLAHEGGHIKSALLHYTNYLFKSITHPNAAGHAPGDIGGKYSHDSEDEYDSNVGKKK